MLKNSLFLLAILVFSFAMLAVEGCQATAIVAENLPNPRYSIGGHLAGLVHPTVALSRMYDLTFDPGGGRPGPADTGRLKIQLASRGKTRWLVVRDGHPEASRRRAVWDLLRGRARLQVVADRGWIDLGRAPAGGSPLAVQVLGLLPAPYGFVELNQPANPDFARIGVEAPDAPGVGVVATTPRYRIVAPAPVAPGETLARFFFFLGASRVLVATGLLALTLLLLGGRFLASGRATVAVCCLIPAVTLLHAVCLPPLQGADETSHAATIERIVFGQVPPQVGTYPLSMSLVAQALDQDRVQFHPEEALPLTGRADRERLANILRQDLTAEAMQDGPPPPASAVQPIDARSPLFFRPFRLLAPVLARLSILDRISAYRLLSAVAGLVLFCAGAWLLRRAVGSEQMVLLYGLCFLVPYTVAAVASCSNYAPAIGLGSLLAAATLTAILSPAGFWRAVGAAVLVGGSWIGVPLWPDFLFVALMSTVGVLAWATEGALRPLGAGARRALRWVAGSGLVGLLAAAAFAILRLEVGNIGTRLPKEIPAWGSAELAQMILVAATPSLLAAAAALGIVRLGRKALPEVRQVLRRVSLALGGVFVAGFVLTPYTAVPYVNTRLPFPDLVWAHHLSFWSNNFSWDQDRLFWKFYWGAFGWHDTFYPDWLYAVARWACVALFLALPFLCARFIAERPRTSAALVLVSGLVVSFCFVSETLRYLQPSNPWGRFILPFLSLAALPLLIQMEAPGRERWWRRALLVAVALHVGTAIVVLGGRYALGS